MFEWKSGERPSMGRDAVDNGAGDVALLFIIKGDLGGADDSGERLLGSL
jgi:hypothetical protein